MRSARTECLPRTASHIQIECDFDLAGSGVEVLEQEWKSAVLNCLATNPKIRRVEGIITILEMNDFDGETTLELEFRGRINGVAVKKKGFSSERSMASAIKPARFALMLMRPVLKLNKSRLQRVACACMMDLILQSLDAAGIQQTTESTAFVRLRWARRIAMLLGFLLAIVVVMTTKVAPRGSDRIERCYIGAIYGIFAIIAIYGIGTLVIAMIFRPQFFQRDPNGIAELAFQSVKSVGMLRVRAVIFVAVGVFGVTLLFVCSR